MRIGGTATTVMHRTSAASLVQREASYNVRTQIARAKDSLWTKWFTDVPRGFKKYFPEGRAATENRAKESGTKQAEGAQAPKNHGRPNESADAHGAQKERGGSGTSNNGTGSSGAKTSKDPTKKGGGNGDPNVDPKNVASGFAGIILAGVLLSMFDSPK
jgi:hypothetical protein